MRGSSQRVLAMRGPLVSAAREEECTFGLLCLDGGRRLRAAALPCYSHPCPPPSLPATLLCSCSQPRHPGAAAGAVAPRDLRCLCFAAAACCGAAASCAAAACSGAPCRPLGSPCHAVRSPREAGARPRRLEQNWPLRLWIVDTRAAAAAAHTVFFPRVPLPPDLNRSLSRQAHPAML